jgi:hypothetical protein
MGGAGEASAEQNLRCTTVHLNRPSTYWKEENMTDILKMPRAEAIAFLAKLAEEREAFHKKNPEYKIKPMTDDYWFDGLVGEYDFSLLTGLPMDLTMRVFGDGGIDFRVGEITIDVKAPKKPVWILCNENKKHHALIIVQGHYIAEPAPHALMLSWDYWDEVLKWPIKELEYDKQYNIVNRAKPTYLGRPMQELWNILGKARSK